MWLLTASLYENYFDTFNRAGVFHACEHFDINLQFLGLDQKGPDSIKNLCNILLFIMCRVRHRTYDLLMYIGNVT